MPDEAKMPEFTAEEVAAGAIKRWNSEQARAKASEAEDAKE